MGGHKEIWYMCAFTSLALEVNMVETFPFTLATFPGTCWYLESFKLVRLIFLPNLVSKVSGHHHLWHTNMVSVVNFMYFMNDLQEGTQSKSQSGLTACTHSVSTGHWEYKDL